MLPQLLRVMYQLSVQVISVMLPPLSQVFQSECVVWPQLFPVNLSQLYLCTQVFCGKLKPKLLNTSNCVWLQRLFWNVWHRQRLPKLRSSKWPRPKQQLHGLSSRSMCITSMENIALTSSCTGVGIARIRVLYFSNNWRHTYVNFMLYVYVAICIVSLLVLLSLHFNFTKTHTVQASLHVTSAQLHFLWSTSLSHTLFCTLMWKSSSVSHAARSTNASLTWMLTPSHMSWLRLRILHAITRLFHEGNSAITCGAMRKLVWSVMFPMRVAKFSSIPSNVVIMKKKFLIVCVHWLYQGEGLCMATNVHTVQYIVFLRKDVLCSVLRLCFAYCFRLYWGDALELCTCIASSVLLVFMHCCASTVPLVDFLVTGRAASSVLHGVFLPLMNSGCDASTAVFKFYCDAMQGVLINWFVLWNLSSFLPAWMGPVTLLYPTIGLTHQPLGVQPQYNKNAFWQRNTCNCINSNFLCGRPMVRCQANLSMTGRMSSHQSERNWCVQSASHLSWQPSSFVNSQCSSLGVCFKLEFLCVPWCK